MPVCCGRCAVAAGTTSCRSTQKGCKMRRSPGRGLGFQGVRCARCWDARWHSGVGMMSQGLLCVFCALYLGKSTVIPSQCAMPRQLFSSWAPEIKCWLEDASTAREFMTASSLPAIPRLAPTAHLGCVATASSTEIVNRYCTCTQKWVLTADSGSIYPRT